MNHEWLREGELSLEQLQIIYSFSFIRCHVRDKNVQALYDCDILNKINRILIPTSCNFFPKADLQSTLRLGVLGLEQSEDG